MMVPAVVARPRVEWDTLAEVRDNITVHLDWVLAHKHFPKRKSTVTKYKKLSVLSKRSPCLSFVMSSSADSPQKRGEKRSVK